MLRPRSVVARGACQWLNTALPSPRPGAAAPAPAVRRRENLRSASFRDYAMEEPAGARSFNTGQPCQRPGVTPAPKVKTKMRAEFILSTRRALLELFLCHPERSEGTRAHKRVSANAGRRSVRR